MSDPFTPPPPPDPTQVVMWTSDIRAIIMLLVGVGMGGTWLQQITDAQISGYVTAAATVIATAGYIGSRLWSKWEKYRQARAARTMQVSAAVASANASVAKGSAVPVTVTVTPPGQDNEVVGITRAEQQAAPAVPVDAIPLRAPTPP